MSGAKAVHADSRAATGALGEELVVRHLTAQGYAVLGRNVRVGRLELDVIAERAGVVVFCEVRTRAHRGIVDPIETVGPKKVQRVRRAAAGWLRDNPKWGCEVRFDAASVVLRGEEPVLTYYEHAF